MPRPKKIENMTISERDELLRKLQYKLGELNGMKISRSKEVMERKKENKLLENVAKKYDNHLTLLRKIKETQIEQIQELISYLDETVKKSEITETKANEVHLEHQRLLRELKKLNKELASFDKELDTY
jgi:DNA-binding protein H-NS